ncbi:MAG: efflux RND transporter periplasmic adaptor subunit [Gammaproteobacteria bacterium]
MKIINFLKKIRKRNLIILLGVILSIIVYKLWFTAKKTKENSLKLVEIELVKKQNISKTVDLIGTVQAIQQTALRAKAEGVLEPLSQAGQSLKKGDLIAKIQNQELEKQYELQKTALDLAEAQLERLKTLSKSGAISRNEFEEKKQNFLEIQRRAAEAKIALDQTRFYAPFDGLLGVFKFRSGAQIQKGDLIVNFYDPSKLILEFSMPLSVALKVSPGTKISAGGKIYALNYVQKFLDEETHMSPAIVEIQCTDCVIGSAIDLAVVLEEKKDVLVIPFEATFLKNGVLSVYTVDANNTVQLNPIVLGLKEKDRVEVLSGLKEGDQLVVQGHHRLYPEMPVAIAKP